MCNASKHPAGCQCGFGPPYPVSMSYDPPIPWEEAILEHPWLAKSGLKQMSWDVESIEWFIDKYNQIVASDLPRMGMISKIKELLGRRKIVVEEVSRDVVNVPLFLFSAPKKSGAKVTYREAFTAEDEVTFRVKVFPIGTGDTRFVSVRNSKSFVASNGQCKVIFAPVPMKVERVSVLDGGNIVGSGHRAEVIPPATDETHRFARRGCKNLDQDNCFAQPSGSAKDEFTLNLANDHSNDIHEHVTEWKSSLAQDLKVGLEGMAGLSTNVLIKYIREIEIKCELPSGRDYLGKVYPHQLWWHP